MTMEISRLTVNLPKKKHHKVKRAAFNMGISMRELVELSIDEFLHRKPNKETDAALQQSILRKGLKGYENIEDLFKDLER